MEENGSVENVIHGSHQKHQNARGVAQVNQNQRHNPRKMKRSKPKKTAAKRKKLTSIPVLTRRLFRLASQCCRENAKFSCEICGMKKGSIHPKTGKPQRVEAHHIMSRSNFDSPLKFDLRNLICLCTEHHKTGRYSAHKHGIWFAREFDKIRPEDADWIIEHSDDSVDLKDRSVIAYIEECLRKNKPLDFDYDEVKPKESQLEFDLSISN
jgi:hypothetical protein